jgi:hypothetical protein
MALADPVYGIALVASLGWFGMGFRYFSYQQHTAAKVLIPREARNSPLFETTAAGLRFLGGFNAAFFVLCGTLLAMHLARSGLFAEPGERIALLLVLACAHFSQFYYNLPVLKAGERKDISLWPVRPGPMRFIFAMDIFQTLICLFAVLVIALA